LHEDIDDGDEDDGDEDDGDDDDGDEDDGDEDDDDDGDQGSCYRCGRRGHWANMCFARTDVHGRRIG
jgi:hypothetical protein